MSRESRRVRKDSSSKKKSYQVLPPREFDDHRPGFKDPLSFSRPKKIDLKDIKRLALSSFELLNVWKRRYKQGCTEPKINGFKIMPEHRGEHQAVFRLSMPEQKRLVWNRSVCFWECLNQGNSYDCRQIVGTLRRIIEPDEFDDCVFPKSKFNELSSQFQAAVESNSNWKRSVLTLHHIIKWLKSLIYLHMFSPQFDFRFCELRFEFDPINSWNPLPVDSQSQSSLYQTNIQFQKLSDFLLISDQIQALSRVLAWETSNWCRSVTSGTVTTSTSLLHQMSSEIHVDKSQFHLLGFDKSINGTTGRSISCIRLLTAVDQNRFVIINCLLDPKTGQIAKLICRSQIPKASMEQSNVFQNENIYPRIIICDKYIVIYETFPIDFIKLKNGRKIPQRIPKQTEKNGGSSLTVWDREGNFKERIELDFKGGQTTCYLRKLPGKRFALIQKDSCEAKSLIFNLGHKIPKLYSGEIEDSNENYFILRIADHVQFYTFNNNVDQDGEYLFSIRSFLDERIRLCSGGNDRYATSRITLPYHIQVFDFPARKITKLNSKNQTDSAKLGQSQELASCLEDLSYSSPVLIFTRPFKQSNNKNCISKDDARLRILASIAGSWQLGDNTNSPCDDPGNNFALCPQGIIIHDAQHDLICFQPLKDQSKSNEGRLLLSLPHQTCTDVHESVYFLPLGKACGRILGNDVYFFSQSCETYGLFQHRISFGLPNQNGYLSKAGGVKEKSHSKQEVSRIGRRVSFKAQISEELIIPRHDAIEPESLPTASHFSAGHSRRIESEPDEID